MSDLLKSLKFDAYVLNERQETLTSVDTTGMYLIKVCVKKNFRKEHDLSGEFAVMRSLNEKGCVSCPTAYEMGKATLDDLCINLSHRSNIEFQELDYIIQDYAPDNGDYSLADVILSLIEQKKLGVYQGDIKPNNIRFNSRTGVCVFIDYDQAVKLSDDKSEMRNDDFLNFCDDHDKRKYGVGNWLRHWHGVSNSNALILLKDGRLDLSQTSVFQLQKTTNSESGIYHTIRSNDIFVEGSRGIDTRAKVLDTTSFIPGERVLDIGCNAGLLCLYLEGRGCKVSGVDNDPYIVVAAKIVSNILGKQINYSCLDLDSAESLPEFDTVMLFSVFHHTRKPSENSLKISKSCKRIIIETRLIENGKQPVDGKWTDTTRWNFESLEDLVVYLEKTFSGFKFTRNLGFVDKGRYILELVK